MHPPPFLTPPLSIAIIDWAFQGVLAFLTVVYPWFMRPGRKGRLFILLTLTGIVWGIWRMFFFDPLTNNDIPGIGYFVTGPFAWLYALAFYGIRLAATKCWSHFRGDRGPTADAASGPSTSTLIDIPTSARLHNNDIIVVLENGIEFSFPCAAYPRLAAATNEQRSNMELSPMGIHWPDIDEDLSISGLVRDHALAHISRRS
jgi:hypothetical protein